MEAREELRKLRESTGMNRKEFCEYFEIPYMTETDWELGNRRVPQYLLRLMAYKIQMEKLADIRNRDAGKKLCAINVIADTSMIHPVIDKLLLASDKQNRKLVFYVHGKGGSASEAEHYKQFFGDYEVYGFDYKAENPWDAKEEFCAKVKELKKTYSEMILVANSIGVYFSMNAGNSEYFEKAYFISPIVNMEKLILDMISWAGASERELEEKKIIPVDFGDDLSWDYLQYVRKNKINWKVPTEILYGSADNLQSIDTINEFVNENDAGLTVMEGGEHWFHTKEQMNFLDKWMRKLRYE